MILLLLLPVFSYPQNTNSINQNDDPKTQLWEKGRLASVKSDTLANHLKEPLDPSKDLKTEIWMKQRSEAVLKYPDSLKRTTNQTNPATDAKSILWERNKQFKTDSPVINPKTGKLNPKLRKE
jgi:hypothetical protein